MNLKLGIWSSYYMELDPESAIERLAKNGINCCELSDEHGLSLLERSEDVRRTGSEFARFLMRMNFEIPQGHLWLYAKICSDDTAVDRLCKWIELYEAIGIKNMVIHCDPLPETEYTKAQKHDLNVERLRILAERIRDKDITVCLENLRSVCANADDILYVIDKIGSERFGICLDTGHLNLTAYKDQRGFILAARERLRALHIADNRGEMDDHLMPFNGGNVDFFEVVMALRDIDYNGIFNLEIPGERGVPLEMRDAKIAYIKAGFEHLLKNA